MKLFLYLLIIPVLLAIGFGVYMLHQRWKNKHSQWYLVKGRVIRPIPIRAPGMERYSVLFTNPWNGKATPANTISMEKGTLSSHRQYDFYLRAFKSGKHTEYILYPPSGKPVQKVRMQTTRR